MTPLQKHLIFMAGVAIAQVIGQEDVRVLMTCKEGDTSCVTQIQENSTTSVRAGNWETEQTSEPRFQPVNFKWVYGAATLFLAAMFAICAVSHVFKQSRAREMSRRSSRETVKDIQLVLHPPLYISADPPPYTAVNVDHVSNKKRNQPSLSNHIQQLTISVISTTSHPDSNQSNIAGVHTSQPSSTATESSSSVSVNIPAMGTSSADDNTETGGLDTPPGTLSTGDESPPVLTEYGTPRMYPPPLYECTNFTSSRPC